MKPLGKFIIAKLSIRKLGSSSVLIRRSELTDQQFAMVNLLGVFTKLNLVQYSLCQHTSWKLISGFVSKIVTKNVQI